MVMGLNWEVVGFGIALALPVLPAIPMAWALVAKRMGEAKQVNRVRLTAVLGLLSQLWILIPTVDGRMTALLWGEYGSTRAHYVVMGGNTLLQAILASVVFTTAVRGRWLLTGAHLVACAYWLFNFVASAAV